MTRPGAAIYRILPDPAAPSMTIDSHDMGVFDGSLKGPLLPRASFRATVDIATMTDADWLDSFPDTGTPNIIRIGLRPTELFCIEGDAPNGDQFKFIYDEHGYGGLLFEKVWQDGARP